MTDEPFKDQKKVRKAKIVTPPNTMKQKVGSGGIDKATLAKAENALENNTIDFKPIAAGLLSDLDLALNEAKGGKGGSEAVVESMLYPAAQFKAQGAMFHYPLVSDIADVLVNFLETVTLPLSAPALEIITAHKVAIDAVVKLKLGKDTPQGVALKKSLTDACTRYYNALKA